MTIRVGAGSMCRKASRSQFPIGPVGLLLASTLLVLTGCETAIDGVQCGGGLIINEYARETISSVGSGLQRLRVEIHNTNGCALEAPTVEISLGGESVTIASRSWGAKEYRVFEVMLKHPVANCEVCNQIRLVRAVDGLLLNEVPVPLTASENQYAARTLDGKGIFALQDSSDATLGAENKDLGPIVLLAERAGFRPRDSSPNAMLQFNGQYWVLGGWSNFPLCQYE